MSEPDRVDEPDLVPAGDTAGAADAGPVFMQKLDVPPPARRPDQDWKWVEEWRAGGEPTPWGPGLALAAFTALLIGSAVYVIGYGLSDRPVLAVAANVIVAAGLTPALWMSRGLPVLRWVALGGAVGTVIAWLALLFVQRTVPA